ncbi:MAG TPA: TonB-dependent receptor [Gemmatimonadaceae bacterium]
MHYAPRFRWVLTALLCCAPFFSASAAAATRVSRARTARVNADVTGSVSDSATNQPIQSAEISLSNASGALVSNTVSDAFGRFTIHNVAPGPYSLVVHMLGFRAVTRPVTISPSTSAPMHFTVMMTSVGVNLDAVQVTATVPVSVDTRTGDQVFKQNDFHGAPTQTTSQILQQSIAGAVRAPTGEVHIRGQHAEYTYYIDGVPVPPGISGSLNELFDPSIVNQINFQTGGWDAEYGGRNAAVVNVTTKIPAGGFHGTASTYAGSYASSTTDGATGFNGQSLSLSGNNGPWGMFVSGARQFSDMRLEPVVFDTSGSRIDNFHNDGTDYYSFGKLQYTAGSHDVIDLDMNLSQTRFAVPFDSTGGTFANDHQRDLNSFLNLGWRHSGSGSLTPELFAGVFYRHASLRYTPDPRDEPQFVFFPDVQDTFNLSENRSADIVGVKLDYAIHPSSGLELKFGTLSSVTRGHEDFSAFNATGALGPQSNSDLDGHDIGVYGQTVYAPSEWLEVRGGLRWDQHDAPFLGNASQLSPRIRLNFFPSTSTTAYVYYGRQFMPTNIEDLRAITQAAQGGDANMGTQPERDDFYEAGLVQRFPAAGLVAKFAGYFKKSDPGIDDNTVPGSNIVTDVNIEHVRIQGLEAVLEARPSGPLTGYLNAALNHAYGFGAITGGFFPSEPPSGSFDLDHDQRLSVVAGATYSPNRFYLSATGIYGSGLTNGVDPSDCGCTYGTGLFDFNRGIKVSPSTILNLSSGYSFTTGRTVLEPELYVENVFDRKYLLKGAFFSGPSVGRPRSVQIRLKASF